MKSDSVQLAVLPIETVEGIFIAHYSSKGLAALEFPGIWKTRPEFSLSVPSEVATWHRLTTLALTDALAGREPAALPPLDLSCGTDFQQQVWSALCKISAGKTLSYSEVAGQIGRPKAVRAVGGACGANPIPVFVPCHRVLAAHHRIGGFSSDMKWKRTLLAREGVEIRS